MPPWYRVLEMAERWGKTPWEIDPTTPPLFWHIRFDFIEETKARISKEQRARSKRRR